MLLSHKHKLENTVLDSASWTQILRKYFIHNSGAEFWKSTQNAQMLMLVKMKHEAVSVVLSKILFGLKFYILDIFSRSRGLPVGSHLRQWLH